MSLKTLSEFSADSNAFDARFDARPHGKASGCGDPASGRPTDRVASHLRRTWALPARVVAGSRRAAGTGRLLDDATAAAWPGVAGRCRPSRRLRADGRASRWQSNAPTRDWTRIPTGIAAHSSDGKRWSRVTSRHLEDPRKRILLIIGASGSGKSSLVLAGVLPRLEERHRDRVAVCAALYAWRTPGRGAGRRSRASHRRAATGSGNRAQDRREAGRCDGRAGEDGAKASRSCWSSTSSKNCSRCAATRMNSRRSATCFARSPNRMLSRAALLAASCSPCAPTIWRASKAAIP